MKKSSRNERTITLQRGFFMNFVEQCYCEGSTNKSYRTEIKKNNIYKEVCMIVDRCHTYYLVNTN